MQAIEFIILQILSATRTVLKIREYSRIFPSFSWGIFAHMTCLDQSRTSENIWWIIRDDIGKKKSLPPVEEIWCGQKCFGQVYMCRLLPEVEGWERQCAVPTQKLRRVMRIGLESKRWVSHHATMLCGQRMHQPPKQFSKLFCFLWVTIQGLQ